MKRGKAFIYVKGLFTEVSIPTDDEKKLNGIEPKYCELEEFSKDVSFDIDKVDIDEEG